MLGSDGLSVLGCSGAEPVAGGGAGGRARRPKACPRNYQGFAACAAVLDAGTATDRGAEGRVLTGRPQELRASSHHVSEQSGDLLEGGWRTNKSREGGGQAKQGQEVAQGPDGLLQQVFNKVERKVYHRMTGIAAVETERVAAHRSTAS